MGHRVLPAVLACVAALALLVGCVRPGPPPAATATRLPSPGAGPWDQRELAVYREALRELEDYEARNQRFLAAGRATPAAKRFYVTRLRDWQASYQRLQRYERAGIRIARAPVVLSSAPVLIQVFQDNAADVVVRRCTDQSDLGTTDDGEPLPAVHEQPVVQEVDVRRYENRTWRIGTFTTTDTPCARSRVPPPAASPGGT